MNPRLRVARCRCMPSELVAGFVPSVFVACFVPSMFVACFVPSVFVACFVPSVFVACFVPLLCLCVDVATSASVVTVSGLATDCLFVYGSAVDSLIRFPIPCRCLQIHCPPP
jgi:hypothetical protein